ncbi:TRAP transporter substrate-binding protein DctP [Tahibacter amnicola]|uniref:TRAP transporter substrate-binding protein DctP n=1 Tax=Tahibacter amnicola TaxID=2976241 RepID=A0ABY6BDA5_9GAMM|nr:TRAP transporter substrate-binding protein DctP [Tahibacter amnicola]UXI66596.1 TRAP transporter substrate-binding protein DctP [Tahibacter amnicola]
MKIRKMGRWSLLALALLSGVASAAEVFKIATVAPDGTAWMREMRAGADAVKTRTEGRVEIKYYPGGVMGDPATVLRKIKIGQLHGGAFTGGEISGVNPDVQIYSLPFIFRSQAEVDAVRAKLDEKIKAGFEPKGFVALGLSGGGFAYIMSTKPIKNRDDLKASKVWVPQGDYIAEVAFKAAGVTPISLPLADVFTSLQTGLIDTAANTMAGSIAFQWHTKIKHVVDLPVSYVVGVLTVDKKAFDKLTPDDQAAVKDEMAKAFARLDKVSIEDNKAALETLKGQGITIYQPSAEEQKTWQTVGQDASRQLEGEKAFSAELYKVLNDELAAVRARQ